jgi:hypothetical protein
MSLADRLGPLQVSPSGCVVCRWYDEQNEEDRATFDYWADNGGNTSELWRQCTAEFEDGEPIPNPLRVKLPHFSHHVRNHRPPR